MNIINSVGFYVPSKSKEYNASMFSDIFTQTDSEALDWALNVVQKIYDRGLISEYIERNKTENIADDKDFVDFWAAITIIFSYVVKTVRTVGLENFNQKIFWEYLRQKGLFNCPDQEIADLTYIASHYYDEIRQRGTSQIYKPKSGTKSVDGEILRIICKKAIDEFAFILQEPDRTGWWINRSSPCYTGMSLYGMANKALQLTDPAVEMVLAAGEGITAATKINFNPLLPYEISFMAKRTAAASTIGVSIAGTDGADVAVNFKSSVDELDSNEFIPQYELPILNEYYKIRVIIYPYNFTNIPADLTKTSLNVGKNLISKVAHRKMYPVITSTSGGVTIKELKISPAYLEWNTCFIQANNFINMAVINRNGSMDDETLMDNVREYLLPYDSFIAAKFLLNLDEPETAETVNVTDFLLNQENEGIISGTNLLKY